MVHSGTETALERKFRTRLSRWSEYKGNILRDSDNEFEA